MSLPLRRFLATSSSSRDASVYIVSCARTPLGAFQGIVNICSSKLDGLSASSVDIGSLMEKSATQLGAEAIRSAVERAKISPKAVPEVIMGCVLQGGLGQAPARQAALNAGNS